MNEFMFKSYECNDSRGHKIKKCGFTRAQRGPNCEDYTVKKGLYDDRDIGTRVRQIIPVYAPYVFLIAKKY